MGSVHSSWHKFHTSELRQCYFFHWGGLFGYMWKCASMLSHPGKLKAQQFCTFCWPVVICSCICYYNPVFQKTSNWFWEVFVKIETTLISVCLIQSWSQGKGKIEKHNRSPLKGQIWVLFLFNASIFPKFYKLWKWIHLAKSSF